MDSIRFRLPDLYRLVEPITSIRRDDRESRSLDSDVRLFYGFADSDVLVNDPADRIAVRCPVHIQQADR